MDFFLNSKLMAWDMIILIVMNGGINLDDCIIHYM